MSPSTSERDPASIRAKRGLGLFLYYSLAKHFPTRMPGNLGSRFRVACCRLLFEHVGKNVNIERGVYFGTGRNIRIGDNSGIGRDSYLYGCDGGGRISIGNNVMVAPEAIILTLSHKFSDFANLSGDHIVTEVVIEDNVWIGVRCTLLPSSHISRCTIVGAGAVVAGMLPPNVVIGGVPAKVIRKWEDGN